MSGLRFKRVDIFETNAVILVNPVNCVGTMGAGLAKRFVMTYPAHCAPYYEACSQDVLRGGAVLYAKAKASYGRPPVIVAHAATKEHWRGKSTIEWVRTILADLAQRAGGEVRDFAERHGRPVMAMPALGCGYGRLPWEYVKQSAEEAFASVSADVIMTPPKGAAKGRGE